MTEKKHNEIFRIGNDPPPSLEVFRIFIKSVTGIRPLQSLGHSEPASYDLSYYTKRVHPVARDTSLVAKLCDSVGVVTTSFPHLHIFPWYHQFQNVPSFFLIKVFRMIISTFSNIFWKTSLWANSTFFSSFPTPVPRLMYTLNEAWKTRKWGTFCKNTLWINTLWKKHLSLLLHFQAI